MDWRSSVFSYVADTLRWWWFVVFAVIITTVGGILAALGKSGPAPFWLWILVAFVGLSIAQFLAYHFKTIRPNIKILWGNDEEFNQSETIKDINPSYRPHSSVSKPIDIWVGITKVLKIENLTPVEARRCRVRITEMQPRKLGVAMPIVNRPGFDGG